MKSTIAELADLIDPGIEAEMLQTWIEEQPEEPLVVFGDDDAVYRAFRADVFGISELESGVTTSASQQSS